MAKIDIRDENHRNLEKIRKLIEGYEGGNVTLDDTLARILAFYRRFVPF